MQLESIPVVLFLNLYLMAKSMLMIHTVSKFLVAVIGFNQTSYTFGEGDGGVEVCAAFLEPRDPSRISQTIDGTIQLIGSTSPDTANGEWRI